MNYDTEDSQRMKNTEDEILEAAVMTHELWKESHLSSFASRPSSAKLDLSASR